MRTLGFTGTENGMTPPQRAEVRRLLAAARKRGAVEFAFGLCIGADEEAALDAAALGYRLHGFPGFPPEHPKRSLITVDVLEDVREPLDRNGDIVAVAHEMVAAPAEFGEILRSGTWATVRRSRRSGKPLSVVAPSGELLL